MPGFGIRAHDLGRFVPSLLIPAIRDAGFDGIQFAPRKLLEGFPDDPSLRDARSAGDLLRGGGIRVDILGCYIDPAHPDTSARSAAMARFATDIRLCREYGASIIATETGRSWRLSGDRGLPGDRGSPGGDVLREFDILVDNFRILASIAREEGVTIAVEPVWEHIVSTPAIAADLLEAVGSPSLGLLLDPCNLVSPALCSACLPPGSVSGKLSGTEAPSLEVLSLSGDRILALHFKDFRYEEDIKRGVTCGEGVMNWRPILAVLVSAGRLHPGAGASREHVSVPAIIEEHAPGRHRQAFEYLGGLIASCPLP